MKFLVVLFCLLCFSRFVNSDTSFLLLHTNDLHAKFTEVNENFNECTPEEKESGDCFGGFARLAHTIRKYRNQARNGEGPEVIYLNAGDVFTGSNLFYLHKSEIASEFLNFLEPNATALGNHEFIYGLDELENYIDKIKSPVVACNVKFHDLFRFHTVERSIILKTKRTRIGIIGYTTIGFSNQNITFYDEITAIKAEVQRLHLNGVKIIIALGHSGFEVDKKIAYYVPNIDIVVGGHTHTFLYTGDEPSYEFPEDNYPKVIIQPNSKKVLVLQAFAFTKYLGFLNVTFNDEGDIIGYSGQPLLMSQDIPQDQDVLENFNKYQPSIGAIKTVIGQTKIYLDADGAICKRKECNLGNFIADALVSFISSRKVPRFWDNKPISLINGGALRQSIKTNQSGNITKGDLDLSLPYPNQLITCSLEGEDVLKTLERNLEFGKRECNGEFLQLSGLKVIYDVYGDKGKRVLSAKVQCKDCEEGYEDVDPKKEYNIVSTDYLVNNECEYVVNCFNKWSTKYTTHDAVVWYLGHSKPVTTGLEDRIKIIKHERTIHWA